MFYDYINSLVDVSFFFFLFYFFYYKPFFKYSSNTLLKLGNNKFSYMNTFTRKHVFDTINVSFIMQLIYFFVKIYNIKFIGSNCFFSSDFFISVRS